MSGRSPRNNPTSLITSSGRADVLPQIDAGVGGNLTVNGRSLVVRDGATLDVRSFGSGDAGTLAVVADSILLDNGSLNGATVSRAGGNIRVRKQTLQLRRGSSITTDAGNTDGGKIEIDTGTLAALENSDISANALQGEGGRVTISARGIFKIEFRSRQTPLSDITATGGTHALSGKVEIRTTTNQVENAKSHASGRRPTVTMRVGIATGTVVAGSLGGIHRLEYTTIGDCVNRAARLESFDKSIDGGICRILINKGTYKYIDGHFATNKIGSVQIRGRQRLTTIYQVLLAQQT